jgi:NAD(P)-dependent dehydrogenase (short-subunit alcohol dehydrogenase family)
MTAGPFALLGKHVLVTGASSGIGRATAQLCSEMGATIECVGRDSGRLNETLASLAAGQHTCHVADIDKPDALSSLLEVCAAEGRPLAGIVHAAGVQRAAPLRIAKEADFLTHFRTNTLSAASLLSAAARRGAVSKEGCSVILVGSVMSVLGAAGLAAYCTSKAALTGLVRAAALELAAARIRVNAVLPGMVDSEMSRSYRATLGAEQVQAIERMHPLGLGQPRDVANAIAFLLTDASRWITGSCLTVDGGYSAQ